MRTIRRFLALCPRERLALARGLAAVCGVRLLLLVLPYRRVRKLLPTAGVDGVAPDGLLREVAWGVHHAARIVPGANCLPQALAAQYLLARRGYASRIRIGVASDAPGRFLAHAWLLSGDRVVLGGSHGELARFTPLTDLAGRGP